MRPLSATFVRGVLAPDGMPRARLPEVAVCGRSNVGKSSLLNVLFGIRGLARVSRTPGRTREINFFAIAGRYHLVDLPGYGYARAPSRTKGLWGDLVRGYLEDRDQLAGIVQLVDARHDPGAQDREMLRWLPESGRPSLVVATKIDKLGNRERAERLRSLAAEVDPLPVVAFSATTREGRDDLLRWIEQTVAAWRDPRPARE